MTNENDWGLIAEFFDDYVPQKEKQPKKETAEVNESKPNTESTSNKAEYNHEEWAARQKQKREEAYTTVNEMALKVFNDRSTLLDFLTVLSNFGSYSVNNCLLIASQCPGAISLKTLNNWKEINEQCIIKRGSKGITVLEPGDTYKGKDGRERTSYNLRTLFDISQIKGVDVQDLPDSSYSDENLNLQAKITALLKVTKKFKAAIFSHTDSERAVYYSPQENRMYINKSADFSIIYAQLVTELAHCIVSQNKDYTRANYGAICQMTAYVFCKRTDENVLAADIFDSIDLPAAYKTYNKQSVADILKIVRSCAKTLTNAYEGELKKVIQNE